jgi:CheY-like chemotaxis protein
MRRLVELFLKLLSHQVEIAENGLKGFEKYCQETVFDAVLMDMRMPVMDGYEATRKIRAWEKAQDRQPVPIVALTAFSTQDEISKSLQAGCNCHLVKPVNRESLERVLAEMQSQSMTAQVNAGEAPKTEGKIKVTVDPDLADLIPGYIEKRRLDIEKLAGLLAAEKFDDMRSVGHKIKGSGGGYGFTGLSEIGAQLEIAAKASDASAFQTALDRLKDYLQRLEIIYP